MTDFTFFFGGRGVRGEDAPPQNFLERSCNLRALWTLEQNIEVLNDIFLQRTSSF